jgi:hypothetical protein
MPRRLPDPDRDPSPRPQVFHYARVGSDWPDVVLCHFPCHPPVQSEQDLAIFCESDAELAVVAEALLFRLPKAPSKHALRRLMSLCSGPTVLAGSGIAIYAPTAPDAPWITVEAISDPTRASRIRGRYSWHAFGCLRAAEAYVDKWSDANAAQDSDLALYRPKSNPAPRQPGFLPGPWE